MTELQVRPDHGGADLAGRAAVEALLRQLYGRVLVDNVLAEPFREVREVTGLDAHIPRMARPCFPVPGSTGAARWTSTDPSTIGFRCPAATLSGG